MSDRWLSTIEPWAKREADCSVRDGIAEYIERYRAFLAATT
jgi:hypothetical protein